jgi:hypothetical protein
MQPDTLFTGRYWLVFEGPCAHEPVLCELARHQSTVNFNIRQASIQSNTGIVALELCGPHDDVKQSIEWLEGRGVRVDPVELQTIEG